MIGPLGNIFVWLIFEAASYSPSDAVCVKLLHGGGEGVTDTADFAGTIQSGTFSNSN